MSIPSGRIRVVLLAVALVVIAVPIVMISRQYGRDIETARVRVSTGSRLVDTACGPIEYATAGEGPPVLVVHGAGGGYDQGLDFGNSLAARGFRVIAVSRFGYLRTPLPADASAQAQADAHACLLDALGIQAVAIIGASAGAPSSMQFALRHPDRATALVLVVPAVYVPRPDGTPPVKASRATQFLFDTALRSDALFWAAIHYARGTVIRALLATPVEDVMRASPSEQTRVDRMLLHILPVSVRRQGLLNDAAVTSTLPRYDLERISVPTLTMSAQDDLFGTYDSARYSAEHIPGARFIGYADGGHVWVGHQEEGIAAIAAFLGADKRAGANGAQ